jgi:hypothetical protein
LFSELGPVIAARALVRALRGGPSGLRDRPIPTR